MITHDSRWRWLSYTMAGAGQCQEEVPAAYSPGAPAADGSPGASQHAGRQSRPVAAGCWWESGSTISSVWKRHLTIRCPVFPLANSRDVPLFHAYPYMRDPEIVAQIGSPCAGFSEIGRICRSRRSDSPSLQIDGPRSPGILPAIQVGLMA